VRIRIPPRRIPRRKQALLRKTQKPIPPEIKITKIKIPRLKIIIRI